MSERNCGSFCGMVVLSAAIVISSFLGAWAIRGIKKAGDMITVTGSAKKPIRSDFIIWSGSISTQKPTVQESYDDIKRYTDRLLSYFIENKIPESSLRIGAIETYPVPETFADGRPSGRILAYRLTRSLEIHSGDVDKIARLSLQINDLIKEGIPLTSYSPQYVFTQLAQLRIEMLGEAAKDARLRAETIAQSLGNKIGPVRSARMGVFQITPRNSTEVSDYGINDTSSLEKDITAVVSVSFSVN